PSPLAFPQVAAPGLDDQDARGGPRVGDGDGQPRPGGRIDPLRGIQRRASGAALLPPRVERRLDPSAQRGGEGPRARRAGPARAFPDPQAAAARRPLDEQRRSTSESEGQPREEAAGRGRPPALESRTDLVEDREEEPRLAIADPPFVGRPQDEEEG